MSNHTQAPETVNEHPRGADIRVTMSGEICVVIATRNRAARLRPALERLISLPQRPAVVVVDNDSDDETAAVAAAVSPQVTVIRADRNLGGGARTLGVRALETELVAFSDDDSWWAEEAFERARALMRAHPRLGLIAARVLVGPEETLDPTCLEMAHSPLPAAPGAPGRPVLGFLACGAIVRRRAYLEVGGFEPRLGIGGEEQLIALDLAAAGWQLAYVEEIIAHHHPARGEPGASAADQAKRRRERNRTMLRNSLWTTWLRRPLLAAVTRTASLAATGVLAGDFEALIGAARGLPWALRKRRALPPEVERAARLVR
jgi:GT2 family glycosyltransferase